MDTKLTLKLNQQIIEKAKEYASDKKLSLSRIVEAYLQSLTSENSETDFEISPFVKSIAQLILFLKRQLIHQMTFINTIISYLSKNGTIDKSMLYEPPFTDQNDQGIDGVFDIEKKEKVVKIIDQINCNALTA
jgi:type I site-specific restriction endonuclease